MNTKPENLDKRRKAYSFTLVGCILAITAIGLLNVWSTSLLEATFYKTLGTLIIGVFLSALLYTLTFRDDSEKTEKNLIMIIVGASTLLAALFIVQIWFDALEGILFGKITITAVIVAVVAGFIITLKDDFFENKRLKDENYLD
jgi:FtsH-binding integral membrane protein